MDWMTWLVVGGAIGAFLLVKRLSLVGAQAARQWLAEGGKVIDVRSPAEFAEGHLPGAINVPLGDLSEQVAKYAPDRSQPLLLHCLSGGRSAVAKNRLKRMGYTRVCNLGSYGRARQIVAGSGPVR